MERWLVALRRGLHPLVSVRALVEEPDGWEEFDGPYNVPGVLSAGVRVEARWRVLTVHHADGDKANSAWWNLLALCQRCHLTIQAKVVLERVYVLEHSDWFKPFVAAYYAKVYLDEDLTREETEARLDELLALERAPAWRLLRRTRYGRAGDLTLEMTLALAALNRQGIVHYPTTGFGLACGCRALSGWNTETFQPFAGIEPCPKHKVEAYRARDRFIEMVPSERTGAELLAELLEEEIGAST